MRDQHSSWDMRLEHLRVDYGSCVVLGDTSAILPGGKITVILNESECSRSTLLRHVIGLSRPTQGHILYGGQDLFALPECQLRRMRRRFGMLFRDEALLGSLTLVESVGLSLHEHTRLPKTTVHPTILCTPDLVGLAEFTNYYPSELPDRMKKCGGLAYIIVTGPPLLFCDEPTSGLDPVNSAQMDQLLLDMYEAYPETTLIMVSRDLASVARIAEHVLTLHDGHVVFSSSYKTLKASTDEYLRRFIDRKVEEKASRVITTATDPDVRAAPDAWLEG